MGEAGISPGEVSKEISEHRQHASAHHDGSPADRRITIVEAVGCWRSSPSSPRYSGYASAKWSTEESLTLARANTARTEANRSYMEAAEARNFDATAFNAWFTAYLDGNEEGTEIAEKRFSAQLAPAFEAWIETDPFTDPDAPNGPTYMDEYEQPEKDKALELDESADDLYGEGSTAGRTADDYVRTAVFLATVLFLVGISGHFRVRATRYGLIGVASMMLVWWVGLLVTTPFPPS